ncbi:MAG TPA: hypothetical protein VJ011_08845, partial [Steroidobacteraceae bacterium]|nr:hypothetical protein [Steroidobacteraceae bacterium]
MHGKRSRFPSCLVLLAAATTLAHAAEPGETVVITATRMEQPSFDTPTSIDTVSGDALREHKLRVNLSEA